MWNPDVGPPPESLATAMQESKTLLRTSVSSRRKAAKQQVATLRPTTSQISRTATTIATTWRTCVHARGVAKLKQRADTTFEEIASDAVQKRRPRAVETKQRATGGSTRLPEPKGRWPGIVEEGSRHQVSQSLGALISKPAVRFKDQRPHSSEISLGPLELARSRSDPWLQRTDSGRRPSRVVAGHPRNQETTSIIAHLGSASGRGFTQ